MIDYADIGAHIREARLKKKITQEQLATMVDVGTTHISHIETGATIPSLQVFISILNALECSADELLCRDLNTSRPIFNSWLSELVADCAPDEAKIIADTVVALKNTLRRNKSAE